MPNKIIVKDHKYYFKIRGLGGPKGDKGDTGPAGPQGPQGPYVNVVAGTTTTLPAGSSAQVTVNNTGNTSTLNFGIPQGTKGDKGDAGTPGAQGPRGFAATVNVGETTTGQPGTNASVVNAGNEHDAVLKFTIPKGEKGETGETGPQGPTGGVKSTVVAELPETGESDKYYLVYRDSEGGTIATADGHAQIENGENGGDLTLDKLYGNAEQTTYSGKNLANYLDAVKATAGTTLTFVDDGFRQVTTATGFGTKLQLAGLTSSTTYTLSFNLAVTSGTVNKVVRVFEGTAQSVTYAAYNQVPTGAGHLTFTTGESATSVNIWFYNGIPGAGDTTWTKIMVEKSSSATDYEKFVGGTPAPNPSYPQPISTVTGAQTVGVTGKNFFDVGTSFDSWFATDLNGTRVVNGDIRTKITGSISDGKIKIDTYDNSGGYWWMSKLISLPKNTTLTAMTADGTHMMLRVIGFTSLATGVTGDTLLLWQTADHTAQTFNSGDYPYYVVSIYPSSASNNNSGVVDRLQLELGSTATAYEPYQGQEYEVNLGKNLFSISQDTIISNAYLNNNATLTFADLNSVSITATGTQGAQYLYRIISGLDSTKSYTFSFKAIKNVKGSTGLPYIRITTSGSNDGSTWTNLGFSGNTNPTEGETYSFAKTLTGYSQYRFMIFNNVDTPVQIGETTTFFDMQLEEGAQTSFAPYFTPIELAKVGTYQDRIYKDDGKWYIEKQVGKVVFDGTETWSASGSVYYTTALASTIIPTPSTQHYLGLSDYFEVVGFDYQSGTNLFFHPNKNLQVKNTNWATLNDWKTWLGSHNTTVYYPLATPTTTEITDDTLRAQLNFLASLYGGENNISLIGTGVQGEMVISYATDYTVNQDIITIDSQARTITLNGQDVYHLKTSESEFLVLAPGENKLYLTSEVSDDSGYAEVKFKQGYLSI